MEERRTIREEIDLYGSLLGYTEIDIEDMWAPASQRQRIALMRDLRRRYAEQNAVPEEKRRSGLDQLEFWQEQPTASTFVYFIQADDTGPVKIGMAGDPLDRLGRLQTGNHRELQLRHVMPGDRKLERQLHHRFREAKIRGEWFGRAYLELILTFGEALAVSYIDCFEDKAERGMPEIVGAQVMSAGRHREMQQDLYRLVEAYGRNALYYDSDVFRIMKMSWGMGREEVEAEATTIQLPGEHYDAFKPRAGDKRRFRLSPNTKAA